MALYLSVADLRLCMYLVMLLLCVTALVYVHIFLQHYVTVTCVPKIMHLVIRCYNNYVTAPVYVCFFATFTCSQLRNCYKVMKLMI